MTTTIKQTTLGYRGNGSDKIYQAVITKDPNSAGYLVDGWNGPRGGNLVRRPQNDGKPFTTLAEAEKSYDALIKEKKNHRKTPYMEIDNLTSMATPIEDRTESEMLPQLLTALDDGELAAEMVVSDEYAVQEKFDGKRIILVGEPSGVSAFNRSGKSCGISQIIENGMKGLVKRAGRTILDGEAIGDSFHAFDMLMIDGHDLRESTFISRNGDLFAWLSSYQKPTYEGLLCAETTFERTSKAQMVRDLYMKGAEGAVLKKIDSVYRAGRQRDQFKYKFMATATVVVLRRNDKNSFVMGVFDGSDWCEVGNCSINTRIMREAGKKTLNPGDLVEVKYLHAFRGGSLYGPPVMVALRDDLIRDDAPNSCSIVQLKYKQEERTS